MYVLKKQKSSIASVIKNKTRRGEEGAGGGNAKPFLKPEGD
jgi:hypothetical protein